MTQDNETGGAGTSGRMRASDAERERAVEQLRDHFEAGRLEPHEFNERMETALIARYRDELPVLLADLPEAGVGAQQAAAPSGAGPRGGGGPPWLRPGITGPWAWRHGPFVPILPLLVALAVVGSIGAVAHGHFPFPLLWLGIALWWFRPWNRQHRGPDGRRFGNTSSSRPS